MGAFRYLNGALCCEATPLAALAAAYGTPLYVYSANRIRENYRRLAAAFGGLQPQICYSVKANPSLAILKVLNDEGASFDIVSGGELFRVLRIGADPARIVFAGVGKTAAEIEAALRAGVGWINVESEGELRRVAATAGALGVQARLAIRLRPGVEAHTHRHISTGSAGSKFGVPAAQALEMIRLRLPHVRIRGVHVHIGSQLGSPESTLQAIDIALNFAAEAQAAGADIDTLDIGGGYPVAYHDDDAHPGLEAFAAPITARLQAWPGHVHIEPGRSVVADAGALVCQVQYVKESIAVVDAGMHTLIRPALYEAHHRVWPVAAPNAAPRQLYSIAGPICESADVLARGRDLPALAEGDQLAVMEAGAYGMAMASNYNSHPLPAEVLVAGDAHQLIRRRQTYAEMAGHDVIG